MWSLNGLTLASPAHLPNSSHGLGLPRLDPRGQYSRHQATEVPTIQTAVVKTQEPSLAAPPHPAACNGKSHEPKSRSDPKWLLDPRTVDFRV